MADDKDSRTYSRRRTILAGKVFDDENRSGECMISDLSAAGAKVRTEQAFDIGTYVYLKIDRFGEVRRAEIMWQHGNQFGLRFTREIKDPPKAMAGLFDILKGNPGAG